MKRRKFFKLLMAGSAATLVPVGLIAKQKQCDHKHPFTINKYCVIFTKSPIYYLYK